MSWELFDYYEWEDVDLYTNPKYFNNLESDKYDYKMITYVEPMEKDTYMYFTFNDEDPFTNTNHRRYTWIGRGATSVPFVSQDVNIGVLAQAGDYDGLYSSLSETFIYGNTGEERHYNTMIGGSSLVQNGTGAVEAGSTSTVLSATSHAVTSGEVLELTSGTYVLEQRIVQSTTSGTITVDPAFSGAPSAGDTFKHSSQVKANLLESGTWKVTTDEITSIRISHNYPRSTTGGIYLYRKTKTGFQSDDWELIEEISVTNQDMRPSQDYVEFKNLQGDIDEEYMLEVKATAANGVLQSWFDDTFTPGDYIAHEQYVGGASGYGYLNEPAYLLYGLTSAEGTATQHIRAKSGTFRPTLTKCLSPTWYEIHTVGWWENNDDEITSIYITSNSSAGVTGTFKLYKKSKKINAKGKRLIHDYDIGGDNSPTEVDGMVLWLDATKESYSDGEDVHTWHDQSPSGLDAVNDTEVRRPHFKTNAINGKPAIRFTQNTHWLYLESKLAAFDGACTVFAVVARDGSGNLGNVIANSQSEISGGEYIRMGNVSGGYLRATIEINDTSNTNTSAVYSVDVTDNTPHIWTMLKDADNHINRFSVDGQYLGTPDSTPDLTFSSTNITTIGAIKYNFAFIQGWAGDIAEIIVYDSELSTADRTKVEAYLDKKYNVSTPGYAFVAGHALKDFKDNKMYEMVVTGISTTIGAQECRARINTTTGSYPGREKYMGGAFGSYADIDRPEIYAGRFDYPTTASNYYRMLFFNRNNGQYRQLINYGAPYWWISEWWKNSSDDVDFMHFYSNGDTTYNVKGNIKIWELDLPTKTIDDVEGKVLWLDASELNYNDSDNVTVWTDRSPEGNDAVPTIGNPPSFHTNIINGRPAVYFDGLEALDTTNFVSALNGACTVFIVNSYDALAATNRTVLGSGSNPGGDYFYVQQGGVGGTLYWDVSTSIGPGYNLTNGIAVNDGVFRIYCGQKDSTNATSHFSTNNGTPLTSASTTVITDPDTTTIGSILYTGGYTQSMVGYVAEVMIFDRVLGDDDRNLVYNYLSKKYNISIS